MPRFVLLLCLVARVALADDTAAPADHRAELRQALVEQATASATTPHLPRFGTDPLRAPKPNDARPDGIRPPTNERRNAPNTPPRGPGDRTRDAADRAAARANGDDRGPRGPHGDRRGDGHDRRDRRDGDRPPPPPGSAPPPTGGDRPPPPPP